MQPAQFSWSFCHGVLSHSHVVFDYPWQALPAPSMVSIIFFWAVQPPVPMPRLKAPARAGPSMAEVSQAVSTGQMALVDPEAGQSSPALLYLLRKGGGLRVL